MKANTQRIAELEQALKEAKSKQVSVFSMCEVPEFQQGEPNHEVLEPVTAKDCKAYVKRIVELDAALKDVRTSLQIVIQQANNVDALNIATVAHEAMLGINKVIE